MQEPKEQTTPAWLAWLRANWRVFAILFLICLGVLGLLFGIQKAWLVFVGVFGLFFPKPKELQPIERDPDVRQAQEDLRAALLQRQQELSAQTDEGKIAGQILQEAGRQPSGNTPGKPNQDPDLSSIANDETES